MSEVQQQRNEAKTKDENFVPPAAVGPKLLVVCQVGMTGKTTISANVLHARLGGRLFSVDSVNQDASRYGAEVESVFADDLFEMRQEIVRAVCPVVVDLGASDYTVFVDQMAGANMARVFDYCIIVSDTSRRAQEEAIETYTTLRNLGMPSHAFRIVLNKAKLSRAIPLQYPVLFTWKRKHPEFPLNEACYVPQHDVFRALQEAGISYQQALNDKTDYGALAHKAELEGDDQGALVFATKQIAQALAESAQEYFDASFKELAIQPKR